MTATYTAAPRSTTTGSLLTTGVAAAALASGATPIVAPPGSVSTSVALRSPSRGSPC